MKAAKSRPVWVPAALGVWLAAAGGVSAAGVPQRLQPPMPQVVLAGLTAALIAAGLFVPPVRRWAAAVDLRAVVALHLTRFVGGYFLYLYGQGELPHGFAVPAGVGDLVVATLAAALLLTSVRPDTRGGRLLYLRWNALGLIDILGVVATAAAQGLSSPESMAALLRLPLSLLPTFLVPLIIASHALIFARLLRRPAEPVSKGGRGGERV